MRPENAQWMLGTENMHHLVSVRNLVFSSGRLSSKAGDVASETYSVLEEFRKSARDAGIEVIRPVFCAVVLTQRSMFPEFHAAWLEWFRLAEWPLPARMTTIGALVPQDRCVEVAFVSFQPPALT
jgi:enamine deaminase RidA (YjgF/YER057c/UK114 family)